MVATAQMYKKRMMNEELGIRNCRLTFHIPHLALLIALLCSAGGCTSVYFYCADNKLIRQAPELKSFEIIGPVHALTWQWVLLYYVPIGPTYQEAELLLVQEAKKMGADAVIDVRFHTENDSDETSLSHFGLTGIIPFLINTRAYHFSGLAIKYTDGGKE